MGCTESKPAAEQQPKAAPEVHEPEAEEAEPVVEAAAEDLDPNELIMVPVKKTVRVAKPGTAAAAAGAKAPEPEPEPENPDQEPSDTPLEGKATGRQGVRLLMEKAFWRGEVSDLAINQFMANYDRLSNGDDGMVGSGRIAEVGDLPEYGALNAGGDFDSLLKKTVCLKLNGGLGTGMGLSKAKSLLPVRDGKTFLDIIAHQVAPMTGKGMEFMLMNSFSTEADTKEALEKTGLDLGKWENMNVLQNKVPKVNEATMGPATHENDELNWCPPGHGDLYTALSGSGKLAELARRGKEYLFVSNSDNLGATIDPKILAHFAASDDAFMMEVCRRTPSDKKGGHLARGKKSGKLLLREAAQVADEDREDFENIDKYQFFNTNNLWIKIPDLKRLIAESGGVLKLPLIVNRKTNDPSDSSTDEVYQLETAMGAAISLFDQEATKSDKDPKHVQKPMSAGALLVPRTRFAPVKTCSDLLAVRSDAYEMVDHVVKLKGTVPPKVDVGPKYKKIQDFEALIGGGAAVPSLAQCKSLQLVGGADLVFEPGVVFKGEVLLNSGDLGDGKTLEAGTYEGDHTIA
eukprot:TRINITY_DN4849_c0_g2_i1.p1 TRINITY_DN4849_c0_g2~~TRINITY_DN4849_c0_g2_i1.p1  ORF type:complete len:574 (+),score=333.16 TRINITY_DN4849_c0_g2_i1:64-1785(+)